MIFLWILCKKYTEPIFSRIPAQNVDLGSNRSSWGKLALHNDGETFLKSFVGVKPMHLLRRNQGEIIFACLIHLKSELNS